MAEGSGLLIRRTERFPGFESQSLCQVSTSPKGTAIRRQHRHSLCLLGRHIGTQLTLCVSTHFLSGYSSVGRASDFQSECRQFEPDCPLQLTQTEEVT